MTQKGIALSERGAIIGTIVMLHGHKGRKEDYLAIAERFCAVGFRCLMVDLPGHGDNPLPFATFGKTERALPLTVLRAASSKFGFPASPALLFGVSQGGGIAWQAASEPAPWSAMVTVSAFSDLGDVVDSQAHRLFGPLGGASAWLTRKLCVYRAGLDPATIRPVDHAARIGEMPVLIAHGDVDDFIPPAHANALFNAASTSRKELLFIQGAGHSNVFVTAAPTYATMAEFCLRHVQPVAK